MDEDDDIDLESRRKDPAPKRGRGRPKKPDTETKSKPKSIVQELADPNRSVRSGVTVHWMAENFGISERTIKARLLAAGVIPFIEEKGRSLYHLHEAAEAIYSTRARGDDDRDLREYVRRMAFQDAPDFMRGDYFRRRNEEIEYAQKVGLLWHGDDVKAVISEILKVFKDALLNIPGEIHAGEQDGVDAHKTVINRLVESGQIIEDFIKETKAMSFSHLAEMRERGEFFDENTLRPGAPPEMQDDGDS